MQWQKYILTFLITVAIFGSAFYLASLLDRARLADIRATQEAISVNILSIETQFELLGSIDCSSIYNPTSGGLVLSDELDSLAGRLSVAEQNLGIDNSEVVLLKKQYSLLQIKDYLLMQAISKKCEDIKPVFVLYFYSNAGDCEGCSRAGEVLTYLRQTYPDLRIYAFDYNLDLSALRTLITIKKLRNELPAFVISNRTPIYGFKSLSEMRELIPELKNIATSSAHQ